jgi:hypothetical protein
MSIILSGQAPSELERVLENPPTDRTASHNGYGASLLFHRMELHQVDRVHLADHDPLLLRELQARCTLCPSKEQCVIDNLNGALSEEARAYCLNAGTLVALSEQAQKISLPPSDDAQLGPKPYYYMGSKGGVVPHWWVEAASRIAD